MGLLCTISEVFGHSLHAQSRKPVVPYAILTSNMTMEIVAVTRHLSGWDQRITPVSVC